EQQTEKPTPPSPPISEDFDGEPRLSLFPRVGDFRPAGDDTERMQYWRTFLEHVVKTSGVAEGAGRDNSRAFALRSIKSLSSVGFFSPLAVEPSTSYRVTFYLRGNLPPEGEAGIGALEYDRFLWIADQFTSVLFEKHFIRFHKGIRLNGKQSWDRHEFTFETSPETGMIHLVLFREGEHNREPVFFDDIRIEKAAATGPENSLD
ncbi:MAG: hypothetical protein GWN87_20595, partial [Desulfuromonadales bacterium]|nr:hypothetical protein [Desulfuromonadales bacterium]NIS42403.1 hypothetical protein [Desulfuromonadales bacterium]